MVEILDSSTTTNILIILYLLWVIIGKNLLDGYSRKKGSNQADKEDISALEGLKKETTQPYDIDLEKIKAQAAYVVEEFKESLAFRIAIKKQLYKELSELKVLTRIFYRSGPDDEQKNYENLESCFNRIADYMSCNKHFLNEIDPDFLLSFENQTNAYKQSFMEANESILSGNADHSLFENRNINAEKLLDLIDVYLEKIFKINPSDVPYNKEL
ncbi:hypothetical protein AB4069_13220 [Vibrio cyclitrophicus]